MTKISLFHFRVKNRSFFNVIIHSMLFNFLWKSLNRALTALHFNSLKPVISGIPEVTGPICHRNRYYNRAFRGFITVQSRHWVLFRWKMLKFQTSSFKNEYFGFLTTIKIQWRFLSVNFRFFWKNKYFFLKISMQFRSFLDRYLANPLKYFSSCMISFVICSIVVTFGSTSLLAIILLSKIAEEKNVDWDFCSGVQPENKDIWLCSFWDILTSLTRIWI